jgi:hypothetical protein
VNQNRSTGNFRMKFNAGMIVKKGLWWLGFLLIYVVTVQAQQRVDIPGTSVSIVPPKSFDLSTKFAGLESNKYRNSTISVSRIPGSYDALLQVLTEPILQSRGLVLRTREDLSLGVQQGQFLRLIQISTNQPMHKWMLLVGDHRESITVTAAFPDTLATKLAPQIEKSLRSVIWDPYSGEPLDAGLLYALDTEPHFKMVKRIGNLVLYSPHGSVPNPEQSIPLLTVTTADYPAYIEDENKFAAEQLPLQVYFPSLERFIIRQSNRMTLNDWPAVQITASAWDSDAQQEVLVWYTLIYAKKNMFHFKGAVPLESRARYLPIFQELQQQFRVK